MGWFGGKNDFIWKAYIVCGILSLSIGIAFKIKQCVHPNDFREYERDKQTHERKTEKVEKLD